jgi:nucleoside-diphosphate-sugar epimerase
MRIARTRIDGIRIDGMRIAVTGASGFCGSAVARLAATTGADVVCLGRRPGPLGTHIRWDATRNEPDLAGADAVIHLAAAVGDQDRGPAAEAKFRLINVDATARLLDAAGDRPVVWVSSASVYRPGPYAGPVREDHPVDSQRTAYGRTKAAGERLALAAGAVVLRPRAVYGDGDRHLLPRLRRIVRGGRAWLPGPDVPLSLTAVPNLAEACLAALGITAGAGAGTGWKPGAFNIADETGYRRDAVVAAVLEVPVRHVPLSLIRPLATLAPLLADRPALTPYAVDQLTDGLVLDTSRAKAEGWRPRHILSDYLDQRV